MSTSKKSSKKSASVSVPSTIAASPAATINPIPATVSAPPAGWVEPERLGKKGRRPTHGLILAGPALAAELREKATLLAQELGPNAVDPQQAAVALDSANGWEGVEAKAATFHTYARSQRGASWNGAMTLLAGLKLGVRYALSRDASFADRFPEVAKNFAPTRRPKKKEDGATATKPTASKKAAAVAAESTPTAPSPATPAPQEATPGTAPTA